MPSPTPRPTLTVPVLELAVLEGDARTVSEVLWGNVLEIELTIMLVVKDVDGVEDVDDVKAVDELEIDEVELDEL